MKNYVSRENFKSKLSKKLRLFKLDVYNFFKYNKDVTRLLIIFLVLLVVYAVKTGAENIQLKHSLLAGLEVQDEETFASSLKDKKSDIKGMSQYDKYNMGLDYHDGSDSDHDGLTDKEEIEVYGTDPLKSSTAGDLYTDGYKVANDMDPAKAYEMSEQAFPNNNCKEVILSADDAADLSAVVEDATDRYSLSDYGIDKIYKGYWLYNYSGTVRLNLKKVFSKNSITESDIDIWMYQGDFLVYGLSDLKKCNYTMDGNQAVIAEELTADSSYYIYVTEKTNALDKILVASSKKMQLNSSKDDQVVFLSKMSPILYTFGFTKMDIYYPDQNDDKANIAMEKRAVKLYNLKDSDKINFYPLTVDEIQRKYKNLQNTIPKQETKDGLI